MIDFIVSVCLNINMINTSRENNLGKNIAPHPRTVETWSSGRADVRSLIKKLKDNEQKENKGKLIFVMTTISVLVIVGTIISF